MKITLRDYQTEAINSIYEYFGEHHGNPLLVLPTGAGKSIVIAEFIRGVFAQFPDQRILMLVHVKELIEQNYNKLITLWPDAPAGIYAASLRRRDTYQRIIFASVQSVYKRAYQIGRFDLIIVDESHLIPTGGEGMYNRLLTDLRDINPAVKVIGLTATPWRMKSGHLIHDESLFTDIAYDQCTIRRLIDAGYLAPLVAKKTDARIDTSAAKVRGGEYVQKDLQAAADKDELTRAAVCEILELGNDRYSWLIFCSGIEHAEHVRDALREHVTAELVTGKTPMQERARIINDFRNGKIRALTNCDVLTTGFDAPAVDLIVFLRPTKSPGLYVQMCGRGMRTADGKADCLVLDFAGNIYEHGPVDQVTMGRKRQRDPDEESGPLVRDCPQCKTMVAIQVRECPECGHAFPPPEDKPIHAATAADRSPLSWMQKATEYEINRISLYLHEKPGKPDSLRVQYWSGFRPVVQQWICLEHGGYARARAVAWWRAWFGSDVPRTVGEALEQVGMEVKIDRPATLIVDETAKYPEVKGYRIQ